MTVLSECEDNSRESKAYWDRRLTDMWDLPYHGMFLDRVQEIELMDRKNMDVILSITGDNPSKELSILECACGAGRYVPKLYEAFGDEISKYSGIDFGTKNINEAKRLYNQKTYFKNVDFYEMDMLEAPEKFKDEKFDLIFMVSALSSCERNYRKILTGLKPLLKNEFSNLIFFEQDFYINCWKNPHTIIDK